MSNRSLLEFNHDFCPRNDEECLRLGRALQAYMRGADPKDLPLGVLQVDFRHHSDPDLMRAFCDSVSDLLNAIAASHVKSVRALPSGMVGFYLKRLATAGVP